MRENERIELMNDILIRRKLKVMIPAFFINEKMTKDYDEIFLYIATMTRNLNNLGFTFSKQVIDSLKELSKEELASFYFATVDVLKKMVGADKTYHPFYTNWPQCMDELTDTDLLINAMVHYLSDGELIPYQGKEERLPLFEQSSLKVIDIGSFSDLLSIRDNLIQSKTSLSMQDKTDLVALLSEFNEADLPQEIPYKENCCLISKFIMECYPKEKVITSLTRYNKTATDVLRLATEMSDGDTSLSSNSHFRNFSRYERKLLLQLLDNCNNIEEDMERYKGKWVVLGEKLHPGDYPKFKKALSAFDKIRNGEYIETFYGKVNKAIQNKDYNTALELLKTRPGEFARRLDYLLRINPDNQSVCAAFEEVADKVSIPVLLQVREHFIHRDDISETRIFFPKGQVTKGYVIDNTLPPVNAFYTIMIEHICQQSIIRQLKETKEANLGKVFVSKKLVNYIIPQNQRSASSGMKTITRCSRFPFEKDFIRLFIHWENEMVKGAEIRTDIDLSCTFLDSNFSSVNHISYTNLRAYGYNVNEPYSVHSGDYVDAPRASGGASEFVDIDIQTALDQGVKYAVVQVYAYTNTPFSKLENLYMGWMERSELKSGEVYEPSTVVNKISLSSDTFCSLPLVFDLEKKEVVWMDLGLTTSVYFPNNVENNLKNTTLTVKGLLEANKPTMYTLALLNAQARGTELVTDRDEADTIFDVSDEVPVEIVETFVKNKDGVILKSWKESIPKENVRIITPWDIDVWQGELM